MVLEIINNEVQNLLTNKKVIIDFYATWCGPCRIQAPIVEEASQETTEVVFAKVDVDQNRELAISYQITNIPTICYFVDGKLQKKLVGVQSKSTLLNL
ncbi:MAG: thioredoxin [Acholeplasmatales bacterium]|jgi:thioredoxin 1|nr:thioredoxin [Acholeplasmatales bacterium]